MCLGLNYANHVRETSKPGREPRIPAVPVFFTKAATSVNGPYDPVPWNRAITQQVDYEVELGAIVGAGGRDISRGDAARAIFGYTIVNDVSARDLQFAHGQWFKGKSLDGSTIARRWSRSWRHHNVRSSTRSSGGGPRSTGWSTSTGL